MHVTITSLAEGAHAMHVTHCCDHVIPCFSPTVLGEELGLGSSPEWGEHGVGPSLIYDANQVSHPMDGDLLYYY